MIVKLSDILGFEDKSFQSIPKEELEAALRRHFAFLPKSATITTEGEMVTITLPDTMEADALEAQRLNERAGKRANEGQFRKAIDIYKRVLELDPFSLLRARRDMAMACVEMGETEEARDHLIEVLRLDPKDCWSWVVLANLYNKSFKDIDTAEKFYQRALAIAPTDAWALNGLGALKIERGDPHEALRCFDAAINSNPKFPNAHYAKAVVLQKLHEPVKAVDSLKNLFRQAEAQDARSAPVFENARRLLLEVETELADKKYPDTFKAVENYRAEVEHLSGFPVRVSSEDLPDLLGGVAQSAWTHGRDHHVIKHSRAVPPPIALHLVAHELTHVRLESLARQAGKNRFFRSTDRTREAALRSLESDIRRIEKSGHAHAGITQLTLRLIEGLNGFLFNCPLDMLIETHLRRSLPLLEDAQFLSLQKMAAEFLSLTTNEEVRKVTARKILQAGTALNGAYALFIDGLFEGATNFSSEYGKFDNFSLSQRLFQHCQSRQGNLGPGDEYALVDEFADMLGLRDWYEWRPDTGGPTAAPPAGDETPQGTTNPELLSQTHPAAVWYLLDALQRYDKLPVEKVREIALEVAQLGRNGLSYADAEKKYGLKSLPGEPFSGLQLMCFMFAGFKRVAPEHDVGMDLNEPFLKALQLFNEKRTKS